MINILLLQNLINSASKSKFVNKTGFNEKLKDVKSKKIMKKKNINEMNYQEK